MQRHSNNLVVISVTPSLLDFVAYEAEDGLKDTVRNILDSKEYVINTVREAMANQVQICSENFPPSVSEVTEVGFDTLSSPMSSAPEDPIRSPGIAHASDRWRDHRHALRRRRRLRTSHGPSGDEFAGTDRRPQLLPDRR